uniref:LIM and SH3 domain protein 1 n=1 Tax=Junco hyemalis TaxID=40217 RepID=A0A8C5ISA2_JUNHY
MLWVGAGISWPAGRGNFTPGLPGDPQVTVGWLWGSGLGPQCLECLWGFFVLQFWHKSCFHCETCKMTLNMKNYKGYEKKPYCNAGWAGPAVPCPLLCPHLQAVFCRPQIRYKEEFEKNKGKGFSVVADTPELQRIKKTQDQISNDLLESQCRSHPNPSSWIHSNPTTQIPVHGSTQIPVQDPHSLPISVPISCPSPVYQQQQQQQPPPSQSYGYKEPTAASSQRNAPAGGGRFRAVYDYNAADEDEVSFQDGDTIINVQQIDDGWMYGTVERTGDTGMLPANYVEAI